MRGSDGKKEDYCERRTRNVILHYDARGYLITFRTTFEQKGRDIGTQGWVRKKARKICLYTPARATEAISGLACLVRLFSAFSKYMSPDACPPRHTSFIKSQTSGW